MRILAVICALLGVCSTASGQIQSLVSVEKTNAEIAGRVIDFTQNHGEDRRIYSKILDQKRDLYVYLPPGYTPEREYPLVMWFHGAFGDEHAFLDTAQIPYIDGLIRRGCCQPMIIACPDGTYSGKNWVWTDHSLYINGCGGRIADHVMCEVVPFLHCKYSICACRCGHALVGVSGGGLGAVTMAIRRRDYWGHVATLAGAVNMRYFNCHEDYFEDFHPATYRWNPEYDPRQIVGKFANGLIRLRSKSFVEPVWGCLDSPMQGIRRDNPADVLCRSDLKPGQLSIRLAYGGKDELNMDAQGASFAWLARCRGIHVTVDRYPEEGHSFDFFYPAQQATYRWLCQRLRCDCGTAKSATEEADGEATDEVTEAETATALDEATEIDIPGEFREASEATLPAAVEPQDALRLPAAVE